MYLEENFLRLRCDKKNLPMIYEPSYVVQHLQAVSTLSEHKTEFNNQYFRLKNTIKSMKYYIKVLVHGEK
jgi:hypothetical protein